MYTSVFASLCVGIMASAATAAPRLTEDYFSAMRQGQKEKRPLAVFVASGNGNWEKAVKEGKIEEATKKLIERDYILVYLDKDKAAARKLVDQFGIHSSQGLVLSDRAGQLQAFHFDGAIGEGELRQQLEKFADPQIEVKSTVYAQPTTSRISYYPSQSGSTTIFSGTTTYSNGSSITSGMFAPVMSAPRTTTANC